MEAAHASLNQVFANEGPALRCFRSSTDGLFDRAGTFTPLPDAKLRALRDLFRAKIFRLLVQRKLLSPALVHKFMQWKHSGFNLFRGDPVPGAHRAELEKLAQYILRHSFAVEKITYFPQTARVIYHSRMNPTTRRNFEVFPPKADPPLEDTATDFLAAITQHIPEKGAQTVKYYGYYSNKARGQRAKAVGRAGLPETTLASRGLGCPGQPLPADSAIPGCASVSDRAPVPTVGLPDQPEDLAVKCTARSETCAEQGSAPRRKIPSRAWRDLIKKAWDVDPLLCPKCGSQIRLISLIEDDPTIEKILRHLDLWEGLARRTDRGPPLRLESEYVREPFFDDLPFGPDADAE